MPKRIAGRLIEMIGAKRKRLPAPASPN